jgi:hypothetical protein
MVIMLAASLPHSGCGGSDCGELIIDVNVRNLFNMGVAGGQETRCNEQNPGVTCTQAGLDFCSIPVPRCQCQVDADCNAGAPTCVDNWCRKACVDDTGCITTAGEKCQGTPDKYCVIPGENKAACAAGRECKADNQAGFCLKPCTGNGDCDTAAEETCTEQYCQAPGAFTKGFCRECEMDLDCPNASEKCDFGWCHKSCTQSSECDTAKGEACTGGLCRPPAYTTEVSISNKSNKVREVYSDKVELHGGTDACAFQEMAWAPPDITETGPTYTLQPEDTIMMRINFRPPTRGAYRAWMVIVSNDCKSPRMPLLLCGQAVDWECQDAIDTCQAQISCTDKDFEGLETQNPTCP